ncbi:MAG TPA: TIGR03557 family F420-dependent LLM class oxidoreductase [Acidimicrobiia bacterium]|nr:TIGR03557 family F420-dependent LLM class oxidoreductase [Acidimicrobiia bacterium]
MVQHGLTLSSEEHSPQKLIEIAVAAEEAGFDFVSISDHFHPWIGEQGHSPFVWSVLGALASATEKLEVGVGVTCPTVRIHPAINAHAAATAACLLEGRFTWGVGSGEALNEHVLGDRWPPADVRLEMLEEAVEVVRKLWQGDSVTHRGRHYTVEDARIFDLPDQLPPIVVSAFGEKAVSLAARIGDGLWITGLDSEGIDQYREEGGKGPIWSQLSLCWDPDRATAVDRAFRLWPNTALAGQLAQDLRTVGHMEQAVEMVSAEDIEKALPCGPDSGPIIESIEKAAAVGVDHIYLHQIGDPTAGFIDFWRDEIRPELGDGSGSE